MRLAPTLLLFASCFAVSTPAYACSEFNLIAQPADNDGYSPNSLSPVALQIELLLEGGAADASCASHRIDITSQTPTGVRDLSNAGATISGTIPPDQSTFASFTESKLRLSQPAVDELVSTGRLLLEYSWIDAGTFFPSGLYTNRLDVEINGQEVATLEPELTVYPAMRLLGDVSSGYGNIDFGTLESFEEVSTRFIFQTNTKLSVTAASQNGGKLIHEDGAGLYSIPYDTKINNTDISTNGAQSVPLGAGLGANSLGTISLKLGDIGTPVAGEYGDVLTLSFVAD